jgi:hypothetical protein
MPETAAPDVSTTIATAYKADGRAIDLGRGVQAGELAADTVVQVPPDFLKSHRGKALQRQVIRGVFGMLPKRL